MTKNYQIEGVSYSFSHTSRKWHFVFGTNTLIAACPGGKETAATIAKYIAASKNRSKKDVIDGIARKNINKKLATALLPENETE